MRKGLSTLIIAILVSSVLLCGCQSTNSNSASEPTTAEEIIKALQDTGFPITEICVFTAENDPNSLLGRPGQYITKASFVDSRAEEVLDDNIGVSNGGSIETFENTTDAKKRYEYISEIAKSSPMFAEYDYLSDKVVLRVSKHLTPEQASDYESSLKDIL